MVFRFSASPEIFHEIENIPNRFANFSQLSLKLSVGAADKPKTVSKPKTTNQKPKTKMKALLYTVDGAWTLEPLRPSVGAGRQFATETEARAWAKAQRITVRRAPDCDSTGRSTFLPFHSLVEAAEWAGYEEERLASLSPSRPLREQEAARYLASIDAEWEDTQHGLVVRFWCD